MQRKLRRYVADSTKLFAVNFMWSFQVRRKAARDVVHFMVVMTSSLFHLVLLFWNQIFTC